MIASGVREDPICIHLRDGFRASRLTSALRTSIQHDIVTGILYPRPRSNLCRTAGTRGCNQDFRKGAADTLNKNPNRAVTKVVCTKNVGSGT